MKNEQDAADEKWLERQGLEAGRFIQTEDAAAITKRILTRLGRLHYLEQRVRELETPRG